MEIIKIDNKVSVSGQITLADISELKQQGVEVLICNRPNNEEENQPTIEELSAAAKEQGLDFYSIPFSSTGPTAEQIDEFAQILANSNRLHAYCRTGNRSKKIWQQAVNKSSENKDQTLNSTKYDVLIIGAGSAGIATAASLIKRNKSVRIALVDPAEKHYYQPGWTMVGGGVFTAESTCRNTADLIPNGCDWINKSVSQITPKENQIILDSGESIFYQQLVVASGLKLDWAAIEGLEETLGRNGVTSNYRYDLAPYTWELVQNMQSGKAIFTQPPMPIKCAGAPQKALYLSASEWFKKGKLKDIEIDFCNAGGALFSVAAYVPALMEYIEKYQANLRFSQTLVKVDGETKKAWFKDGEGKLTESPFDFLHVCPPQVAPDFIRASELSDDAGWLAVDPATLRSSKYDNIWGVGDVINTTNAKTMAAVRKQAPVVAHNICSVIAGNDNLSSYDGYGSCPLTVEHGKIVLAEFTYGGKLSPTFPSWLNEGTRPTGLAWFLKAKLLPPFYWYGMLKGREWLTGPHS